MKKSLILIAILAIVYATSYTQELKGYKLGSVNTNAKDGIPTTLIGENYYILTHNLNDGSICRIMAIPSIGENVRRVYYSEIEKLVKAFENKYSIKFEWYSISDYDENEGKFYTEKDGIEYYVIIKDYNEFMDVPYDITILMQDVELYKIYKKEEQERANQDL